MAVWNKKRQDGEEGKEAKRNCRNFVICLIFMCGEGILLHLNDIQRHDSMYLILPVCMVYLFRYLLLSERKEERRGNFYLKGPMLFYFLHPLVILVVRGFVKVTKLSFVLTVSPVYYLAVVLGSFGAVYVCIWLLQYAARVKKRRI